MIPDPDAERRIMLAFAINGRNTMLSGDLMVAAGYRHAPDLFGDAVHRLVAGGKLHRGICQIAGWRAPTLSVRPSTLLLGAPAAVVEQLRPKLRAIDPDLSQPTTLLLLPPFGEALAA